MEARAPAATEATAPKVNEPNADGVDGFPTVPCDAESFDEWPRGVAKSEPPAAADDPEDVAVAAAPKGEGEEDCEDGSMSPGK